MPHKVLLVDDSPVDRVMYRTLLNKNVPGLSFEEAGTAREALALLRLRRYDCVFLDYLMPDGNGLEVLTALDKSNPSPIIMLTATDDTETAVEALKAGASDYLIKDRLDTGTIVSALQGALMASEAHQHRDASHQHHALVYSLVQQGEDAFLAVDLANLNLVEASAVGLARMGLRRADVIGRDVRTLDLFGGKSGWASFVGALRDNESVPLSLGAPGDHTVPAQVRSQAVKVSGKPYLLLWVRPA